MNNTDRQMCTLITQHTSTKLALVVLKHDCCTQLICEGLHLLITPRRTHTGTGVVDIPLFTFARAACVRRLFHRLFHVRNIIPPAQLRQNTFIPRNILEEQNPPEHLYSKKKSGIMCQSQPPRRRHGRRFALRFSMMRARTE